MPNESSQTIEVRYKRCPYCGGDAKESECGQVDHSALEEIIAAVDAEFPKKRPKPQNKMIEKHEDK